MSSLLFFAFKTKIVSLNGAVGSNDLVGIEINEKFSKKRLQRETKNS